MATTQDDTIAELQRTVAELRRERDAALAREAALAEVLDVINRSPGDPGPVFDTVLEKAHSLCGAAIGALSTFDGTLMHTLAMRGFPDDYSARMREPWPPPAATAQRLIDGADVVHIPDATEVGHGLGFLTGRTDMRTALVVPLRKDGVFLGQITAFRDEVRPFAETEIALLESFAAQAVIAMENARLLGELHERTAELAERNSAFGERIEHQSATIDVLKAMSASPGDAQPVFDLIAKRARDICGGYGVTVCEFDGSLLQWRAATGVSEDPAIREAAKAAFPMPPTRDRPLGRAILDREIFHSRDHNTEPGLLRLPHYDTVKSSVTVPMMSGGVAIGALALGSREKGGFSDAQVDLLKTFAEQAVIAISSAETYRALQARTAELTARDAANRALIARQSASVEVLKAISASPDDPQPVFELIARLARELCVASRASVTEYDGALLHMRARDGYDPMTALLGDRDWPRPPGPDTIHGRVIQNGGVIQVHDVNADDAYAQVAREIMRRLGSRSLLGVPLLREGRVIGAITLGRDQTGGFGDDQVELVRSFAEQAVIAISSATALRALHQRTSDLQESLEYQTATSDVLKVIGRSTFDLQPVLDAVVETAARLCDAEMAVLTRAEGDHLRMVANYGFPPAYEAHQISRGLIPRVPDSPSAGQRAWHERRAVHIHDAATVPGYPEASLRLANQRTTLAVPLVRDGEPIGTLSLARQHVEPFTDRQIELVSTFADQAVIAIENTRLITEQREALEQQIAAAEVLQVINANPGNVVPVFDSILENAHRVCGASIGSLWLYDGEMIYAAATRGVPEELGAQLRRPRRPSIAQEALIREKGHFFHSVDRQTDGAELNQEVEATGVRTILGVPLVKDGRVIGIISAHRPETRPFSDKEIVLLENFAAQAVIAIENTRLINEQREALEQQTATAEVLQVINGSPGDLAPVFEAILEKAHTLCGATIGALATFDGEFMHPVAIHGYPDDYVEQARQRYRPSPAGGQVLIGGARFNHLPDMQTIQPRPPGHAGVVIERTGLRTFLAVPLRKDGVLLGQISAFRTEVRPFSDKEIALLENFATQAVIAMENARLINELRQRTAELAERNIAFSERIDHQAATIDVLKVMSASPGDAQPVFDLIVQQARKLLPDVTNVTLFEYDGELVHLRTTAGGEDFHDVGNDAYWSGWPRAPYRGSISCRAILDAEMIHIRNLDIEAGISPEVRNLGHKTQISIPLMRDGRAIGALTSGSMRVDGVSDTQIQLLKTFAEQAVIAIGSADTYRALQTRTADLQESLEYQTATGDVLKVISRTTFDLAPVLHTLLTTAMRLCEADNAVIMEPDGDMCRVVGASSFTPEAAAFLKGHILRLDRSFVSGRVLLEGRTVQVADVTADPEYTLPETVSLARNRTVLGVPLLRDGAVAGVITLSRQRVQPFTQRQIDLVSTFADQAVIAIENTRLLTEQQEALEQQTATAEVLQVINTSPGNLAPVFDAILEKAHRLCGVTMGALLTYDGEMMLGQATRGYSEQLDAFVSQPRPLGIPELAQGERFAHFPDMTALDRFTRSEFGRLFIEQSGVRTYLSIPLRKDGSLVGMISAIRTDVNPFTDKQIALLENFAAQAVIAMENARLLDELRARTDELAQRQAELRITFENMGDGVAMFDETQHLVAWNRKFQDILDVPDDIIARRQTFSEYVHYLARRGEYHPDAEPKEHVRRLIEQAGQSRTYERTRPDGRVIEIRHNPVPSGGFVLIYADITERKRSEAEIRAARDAAEGANRTIEAAYRDLKTAQANLIQAEKMASLGQLTAGIAHEIKNPLNFVNNFAALSVDLLVELQETAALGFTALTEKQRAEIEDVSAMLTSNLEKITEHGKRADGIVKAMLEHSRGASGERRTVDINALADEALNLAYHGARAQDQSFNILLERDFDDGITPIEVNPQEMTRVFLNLFSNGFYAANKRERNGAHDFRPVLKVTTRAVGDEVVIRVRDNGTGIPDEIRDKLFEPFFTTKPTGEGTGLGLSITYDIVTKAHGGTIAVASEVGEHTEFVVTLPRQMFAVEGAAA